MEELYEAEFWEADFDDLYDLLHWRRGAWHPVRGHDWMRFKGLSAMWQVPWAPLPHVGPGEHFFVVCAHDGKQMFNIIPHRYLIDADGRMVARHYFGVLSAPEIERFEQLGDRRYAWPKTHPLTAAEDAELDAFFKRVWRSWLPPVDAMRKLLRQFPARPKPEDPAWEALVAGGVPMPV